MLPTPRGPCAVRAVVDGVTKCHCVKGTVKAWHRGVDPPYEGREVCDAYRCKKDAGVKTEKTGQGHKRQRTDSGGSNGGGGGTGGDGGMKGGSAVVLQRPEQIIGHRLFNMDPLPYLDPRRGETLLRSNYAVEFYLRGIYERSDSDPGLCDTFWRPLHELVDYAKRDAQATERLKQIVNMYCDNFTQSLNDAFGATMGGEEVAKTAGGVKEAAAPTAEDSEEDEAAAVSGSGDGNDGGRPDVETEAEPSVFDGTAAAAAAATTTAAQHDELVARVAQIYEAEKLTLKSIYDTFEAAVAASEFSIWLRLGKGSRRISAVKQATIDKEAAAWLAARVAGTEPAPTAAAAVAAAAAAAVAAAVAAAPTAAAPTPTAVAPMAAARRAAAAARPTAAQPVAARPAVVPTSSPQAATGGSPRRGRSTAGSSAGTSAGAGGSRAHDGGPVWRGALPYEVPPLPPAGVAGRGANDPIAVAQRAVDTALNAAGQFAIQAVDGQWPPMPRDGGFCYCGTRWAPGSEHFDPKNRLDVDKDPQMGPCLGWLCVRIRAARGPCGDRTAPDGRERPVAVPSEPYED